MARRPGDSSPSADPKPVMLRSAMLPPRCGLQARTNWCIIITCAMTDAPHPSSGTPSLRVAPRRVWILTAWGVRSRLLDTVATLGSVLVLLASRVLFLPSGPWEWDETLFARGILRFDLRAHFPHPPGFPLWMLLGWLVHPFVSEPLRGLQLLSSLASCVTFWPLAALGRRVAPPPVAAAAAMVVLVAPGVWLHAVRGFSSTPAAFFALWAAALAVHGLEGRRFTGFTLLVTAAFLVRPILLPSLALLWLAGAASVRPLRRALPAATMAVAVVLAGTLGMVAVQGSWTSFAKAFVVHAATHARNLERNVGGLADVGLIKGLGGVWLTSALAVLAVLGIATWRRRTSARHAGAVVLILATGLATLLWLQNRTFPRYAVPFQLALAPLVAGGAAAVASPVVATAGLAALALLEAGLAFPAVREQHERLMPGWEALSAALRDASQRHLELVVEPGLYPFLSYREEVERWRGRPSNVRYHLAPSSPDARTGPRGPYLLVTDFPHRYLSPPFGRTIRMGGVSDRLRPLTQQRFLDAAVIEGPPLPLSGWWPPEKGPDGELFIWGAPSASLVLPPYPTGTALRLDLCPAPGPAPIVLAVNGREALRIPGELLRRAYWIEPRWLADAGVNTLTFQRARAYPPGPNDPRRLAVRLFGIAGVSTALPWAGPVADARQRERLRIRLDGEYGPENFAAGRGTWTAPEAQLWLPAGRGTVTLVAWAPRPEPPDVEVFAGIRKLAGPIRLPRTPTPIVVDIPETVIRNDGVALLIRATPFVPALHGNPRDGRKLGIVLGHVRFQPAERPRSPAVTWLYPE